MGYFLFLIASLFLDSNIFSVPLVFIASLLVVRHSLVQFERGKKKNLVFSAHRVLSLDAIAPLVISLVALVVIDAVRMQRTGISPIIFLIAMALLIMYGRFFEISKSRFFAGILVIMAFLYAYFTDYDFFCHRDFSYGTDSNKMDTATN